jgi:diphosphomevalonate decarboxylase
MSSTFLVAAEAPANIALIKYMGKVPSVSGRNRPTNSSLSMTLDHLITRVEIWPAATNYDGWAPLQAAGFLDVQLSESGRQRYLAHFEFMKQKLGIQGRFEIRSANNFPADCGVASSASSFAALTLATYHLAQSQNKAVDLPIEKLAEYSRIGSGSSIRSFMGPFVIWDEQGVRSLKFSNLNLFHQLVVVGAEKKLVSSSEAHQRVATSLCFRGRPERAEERLKELIIALEAGEWVRAHHIVWAEFWDMHSLFSTSEPPFQYMNETSYRVLDFFSRKWAEFGDGPLMTMDAGANVHLIYRQDQAALAETWAQESGFQFLSQPRPTENFE